ncbi:MAG: hypothetical protein KKD77_22725 [Gammaproteobacteria bacterium]|nr:hypothetical protein [Gammaproteobacteria bacterium]
MNYRLATVLSLKSLGAPGVEVIDINLSDLISRIDIGWQPTLADTAMAAALAAGISKIELVDGSDVLHSLNGRESQALCIYDRRVPTMNHAELINGADAYATFGIDFGRFLYDPDLAFDPKKFLNPQLKITHDRTAIGASTSTHYLEVYAHCFDEKVISPIGFLTAKEYYSYTPAAENAYEHIDLPTDHPIRQLLLRNYRAQYSPRRVVDYFRLDEDNEKRIPIDVEMEAYIRRMKGVWHEISEGFVNYCGTGTDYYKYVTPTDHMTQMLGCGDDVTSYANVHDYIKGGYVQIYGVLSAMMFIGHVMGYLPHHCIQFPFGRQDQIDDWYDVTKLGSLRARLQSGSDYSGATVSLILQQLRRY